MAANPPASDAARSEAAARLRAAARALAEVLEIPEISAPGKIGLAIMQVLEVDIDCFPRKALEPLRAYFTCAITWNRLARQAGSLPPEVRSVVDVMEPKLEKRISELHDLNSLN